MNAVMSVDRHALTQVLNNPAACAPQANPLSLVLIPRCSVKCEKLRNGLKITCLCTDESAAAALQACCTAQSGCLLSCCLLLNGQTVCCCNITLAVCKCEVCPGGVCFTCTSGDPQCCQIVQQCCDCIVGCMNNGCSCCVCLNNTPVCCGTC